MVTGAYVNVDWVQFTDALADPGPSAIRQVMPAVRGDASAQRLVKKGNTLFVEKNGMRFDLTGHRLR